MKKGFTLAGATHVVIPKKIGHVGFTLAEVLITLGIIGVVAAMTMPTLIANYKKKVVVTRLQKFHSTINQALKLSEAVNGEFPNWDAVERLDGDSMFNWWNKYLNGYFNGKKVEKTSDGLFVTVADGSGFGFYNTCGTSSTCNHIVYCVDYKSCKKYIENNNGKIYNYPLDGKNTFLFAMGNKHIIPYSINDSGGSTEEEGDRNKLLRGGYYGCANTYKAYCAALIQYDGWEIKDDYPIKF